MAQGPWRRHEAGGDSAAAGIHALTNHVDRLSRDHENAGLLAQGLAQIKELRIDPFKVQTNMVFFTLEPSRFKALQSYLKERGVLISGREKVRLVTHLDVSAEDIQVVIGAFKDYFSR